MFWWELRVWKILKNNKFENTILKGCGFACSKLYWCSWGCWTNAKVGEVVGAGQHNDQDYCSSWEKIFGIGGPISSSKRCALARMSMTKSVPRLCIENARDTWNFDYVFFFCFCSLMSVDPRGVVLLVFVLVHTTCAVKSLSVDFVSRRRSDTIWFLLVCWLLNSVVQGKTWFFYLSHHFFCELRSVSSLDKNKVGEF